ncbi:glycosyltransferase family A protein [Deltaproteobacteria bacterium IMCC39524]|nr:glycosyltransferase family A protein [Deltaproteobacteria bacterium IMCC39524]
MKSDLSPIILFVYNRPEHTRRTLEALLENELAEQSDLFVYCDGPGSVSDREAVEQVRDYVRGIAGFRSVEIVERAENIGLACSIISGITEVLNHADRVVVLEDDIVTSRYFLRYMNDALEHYKAVDRVMHVSGYMFPIDSTELPQTFFYRSTSCWGWGTWASAWQFFKKEPDQLLRQFSTDEIERFSLGGVTDHWAQAVQNVKGRSNTWAVFWYASVFKRGGLCLHPAVSMTMNIGHDGSGVHSRREQDFNVVLASSPVKVFTDDFFESSEVVRRLVEWYTRRRGNLLKRATRIIQKILDAVDIFLRKLWSSR